MAGYYTQITRTSGTDLAGLFRSTAWIEAHGVQIRSVGKQVWLAPAWFDADSFVDFDGPPEELGILIGDYDERTWRETTRKDLSVQEACTTWPPCISAGLGVHFDILPMRHEPTTYGHLSWSFWKHHGARLGHRLAIEYPVSIEDLDGSFKAWQEQLFAAVAEKLEG